jgi:beta-glucosidase
VGELDDPDVRARDVESRMTDDERFTLLLAVMGVSEQWPLPDDHIPPALR